MLPERKDAGLLYDMISAAKDIEVFMEDCDFESFSSNKMLRYAVERQLLVIGEAASGYRKISEMVFHLLHCRQLSGFATS